MTEEENAKWADKINAINTRVEEMAVKFLVGDESLDNFDAYVEEINGMGLQECLDIEQAALDSSLQSCKLLPQGKHKQYR